MPQFEDPDSEGLTRMDAAANDRNSTEAEVDDPQSEGGMAEESATGRTIVLAWLASIACHIVLFTAMFLVPWLSDVVGQTEELPVAHTELLGELTEVHMEATGKPDFNVEAPTTTPESLRPKPSRFEALVQPVSASKPELSIIGIGGGGGEDFAKYGLSSAGGPGPKFFGLGGRARGARRIVYVVDRSGSMMTTFEAVRQELRKSIAGLRRSQRFHVIFFNAGPPVENRPKKLVPATSAQQERLLEFVATIQAEGSTDPIPAMQRAFAVKPDLIYFLTDGDFDPLLLEKLRQWNRDQRVRIFALAYVSEAGRVLLEQIAREHNGEFKFISEDDIF